LEHDIEIAVGVDVGERSAARREAYRKHGRRLIDERRLRAKRVGY
jgi:hypothetical protein